MKIGIISDTHDQIENIKKAIDIFKKENVELILHLGDWCSPFVLHLFKDSKCAIKSVFGNNDSDIFKHLKYKPENIEFFDKYYTTIIEGKKIAMIHGDPTKLAEDIIKSQKYDVVLKGHDHIAKIENIGKTLLINPGNLVGPFSDMTKEWTNPSIAIYETITNKAELINID